MSRDPELEATWAEQRRQLARRLDERVRIALRLREREQRRRARLHPAVPRFPVNFRSII